MGRVGASTASITCLFSFTDICLLDGGQTQHPSDGCWLLHQSPVCALTVKVRRTALLDLHGRFVLQLQAPRRQAVSCGRCAQQGIKPVAVAIGEIGSRKESVESK